MVGIDRSFYSRIERGARNPSLDVALKIAEVLKKDVSEIFLPNNVSKGNTPQNKAG
jgi:DNA-binding XRE family transcriptional regulator